MQKITPFLWFDGKVEEAIALYTSFFEDAQVTNIVRYTEAGPGPAGSVLTAGFRLHGQEFIVLNGGPQFKFNESISFVVNCELQEEVDTFWEKLSEGGKKSRCGWLKDQFGLWWQIVPTVLPKFLSDPDAARAGRVMQAMLQMDKIEIALLEKAYHSIS